MNGQFRRLVRNLRTRDHEKIRVARVDTTIASREERVPALFSPASDGSEGRERHWEVDSSEEHILVPRR